MGAPDVWGAGTPRRTLSLGRHPGPPSQAARRVQAAQGGDGHRGGASQPGEHEGDDVAEDQAYLHGS